MQVRAMRNPTHSRRDVLKASAAMAAGAVFAEPLKAATAEPSAVTPALIEAARKEARFLSTRRSSFQPRNDSARHSRRNTQALPCALSARARNGFFSASARNRQAVSMRSMSPFFEKQSKEIRMPKGGRRAGAGRK